MKKLIAAATTSIVISKGLNRNLILANSDNRRKNISTKARNIAKSKGRSAAPDLLTAANAVLKKTVLWTTARYRAQIKVRTGRVSFGLKKILIVTP